MDAGSQIDEIVMTREELEEILVERDNLRLQLEISSAVQPEGETWVANTVYDEHRAPVIDRPCWVAFVYRVGLQFAGPTINLSGALGIGRSDPVSPRLSGDETDLLNREIQRVWGTAGVSVTTYVAPPSPTPEIISGFTRDVVAVYTPERRLAVGVKVTHLVGVAVCDFATSSEMESWGVMDPVVVLASGLTMAAEMEHGHQTQRHPPTETISDDWAEERPPRRRRRHSSRPISPPPSRRRVPVNQWQYWAGRG